MFESAFSQNVFQQMLELNQSESTGLSSVNIILRILHIANIAADYGNVISHFKEVGLLFDNQYIYFNTKKLPRTLCIPIELFNRIIDKIMKNDCNSITNEKIAEKLKNNCNTTEVDDWRCFSYPSNDGIYLKNYIENLNGFINNNKPQVNSIQNSKNIISMSPNLNNMKTFLRMELPPLLFTTSNKIKFKNELPMYIQKPDVFFTAVQKKGEAKTLPSVSFSYGQYLHINPKVSKRNGNSVCENL